tara:strand:- start:5504 stop:6094 length:591 start_codon:yes stop_codon:yes gene_type:complete
MKKNHQKIQVLLILIGLILILTTYFFYPNMKKTEKTEIQQKEKILEDDDIENEGTTFQNVEYRGLYDLDKPFKITSENAYILDEEPDVVHMTNMHVVLYLTDGRVVNITSNQGRYNKETYDCFFEKNVKATDGETNIIAKNLDLLATKNLVEIYNDVNLNYPTGSLKADKINYDFETKYFKVSMFDEELINMKVIK